MVNFSRSSRSISTWRTADPSRLVTVRESVFWKEKRSISACEKVVKVRKRKRRASQVINLSLTGVMASLKLEVRAWRIEEYC